jgi:predicted NBD/HSP70 family sugar kinase
VADRQEAQHSPALLGSARAVIDAVLREGPISRAEIARSSGLSKQTISEAMRDLERDGWVREVGQTQGPVGRSAVTYEVRADAAFAIGIDIGGTKLQIALADLKGGIVAEVVEPTERRGGPEVVDQIARLVDMLASRTGVARSAIRSGAMGSPGYVDPASGGIAIAPNIPGIDALDMPAVLKSRLGFPVAIENDVNLAAMGEQWQGSTRDRARSFVFLALGTGIGMGVVADGKLIRGARGAAGEIAYLPVGGDPFDARNTRFGTLESAIGSEALAARYAALGGKPSTSVREIFDALESDEMARITIDEASRTIAAAILAIGAMFDPELVVLGGSIGTRHELKAGIERYLCRCMPVPIPIVTSALGSRATLVGAIGRALVEVRAGLFGVDAPPPVIDPAGLS